VTITVFGIRNCDTVKKARSWLDAQGIAYRFHDFRAAGVDEAQIRRWAQAAGIDRLLNRAGTTFRQLPAEDKACLDDDWAVALMVQHPTLIKRPVLERGDLVLVGFKPEVYAAALK